MSELVTLVDACKSKLALENSSLGEEYYYSSLPLCVIDSVFSIGVTYTSVQNTVDRYCKYFGLEKFRKSNNSIPETKDQESIRTFNAKLQNIGIDKFTNEIFNNRQRTSTKNGILKTQAVAQFSSILSEYKVNYFQDISKIVNDLELEKNIKTIPGQTSGLSLKYFFMLSGSKDLVKPDRMILRFLEDVTSKKYSIQDAQVILVDACEILKNDYSNITPRLLDHEIWKYQRKK